jgi:hypothetical protein
MTSESPRAENDTDHEPNQSAPVRACVLSGGTELGKWDRFVCESPEANPFATTTWRRAVSECLGYSFDLWVVYKGAEWLGGVPLFWRKRFGRPVCLEPPQCAYSSVLFNAAISRASYPSKVTSSKLDVTGTIAKALSSHYSSTRMKLLPAVGDVRAFQWEGWTVNPSYTYVIDLKREMRCDHAVRKHVRKCRENGAVLSLEWCFDRFRSLAEDTISRQGLNPGMGMRYEELERIACRMRDAGLAWMATALTADGKPLASRIELGIPGTSTLFDWVAGSSSELFSLGGNAWLMTEVAEAARQRGYSSWDLCGANYRNIATFKAQMGGDLAHGWNLAGPVARRERLYGVAMKAAVTVKHLISR